ncbi:MAG: nucleotide exchange factor GrpE [Blastocatellia bacterium]|nr:nucleotide exchange factor GrpE [Blastocatellia bacterium]
MGKKKDEPVKSQIEIVEGPEEAEFEIADEEIPQIELISVEEDTERPRGPAPGAQVSADELEELSKTWDAAWAGLQAQVDALTQEKTALYDQLLRRQAEFDNYRKRVEREKSEIYQRARAEVLLEFLPVLDNFERALSSLEQSEGDAKSMRHGVELIHKQFNDALVKFGLQPVEAVGQAFDPNVHEAVTIEPTEEHEENTVLEEFQRGYKLGDRLLRPAKVKVAASPNR